MRRVAGLSALVVLGVGCATTAPSGGDRAASTEQGITVLHAEVGSLSLSFRSGETVIFMEALRGGPGAYPDEPEMPAFEVDARFVADNGVAFYTRQGGDDMIDPSWAEAMQRQTDTPVTRDSNAHLFQLGAEIAATLRSAIVAQVGADVAAQLGPEIEAIEQSAADLRRAHARALEFHADYSQHLYGVAARVEGELGEVAYGTDGPEDPQRALAANFYYIAVHKKCILACAGDHSATRIYEWIGQWNAVHNFCNHGECAGSPNPYCAPGATGGRCGESMSEASYLPYYEAVQDYKPAWTAQTCSTGYHWDSSNGGHNCHDDTRRQMSNFVYNRFPARNAYHCSDNTSTNRWKAPVANSSRHWGYNHPWHCAYNFGDSSNTVSCPASYQGTNDGCDCGCRFPDGTMGDPDCLP